MIYTNNDLNFKMLVSFILRLNLDVSNLKEKNCYQISKSDNSKYLIKIYM